MNVVDLRSTEARSRTRCGGKGAGIATLAGEAMPVPEGFVVTTDAFAVLLETKGLLTACDELHAAEPARQVELGERLQRRILATDFPAAIEDEVSLKLDGYDDDGRALWAVRSSAVAEDTADASFAGQYDTVLGVSSGEVTAAIQQVWGSAFCERAVRYRQERGTTETRMAVVVQLLLRPDSAGVCFTADPFGKVDKIIINANYGLGESVVSGTVIPDTYEVDRREMLPTTEVVGLEGDAGGHMRQRRHRNRGAPGQASETVSWSGAGA